MRKPINKQKGYYNTCQRRADRFLAHYDRFLEHDAMVYNNEGCLIVLADRWAVYKLIRKKFKRKVSSK